MDDCLSSSHYEFTHEAEDQSYTSSVDSESDNEPDINISPNYSLNQDNINKHIIELAEAQYRTNTELKQKHEKDLDQQKRYYEERERINEELIMTQRKQLATDYIERLHKVASIKLDHAKKLEEFIITEQKNRDLILAKLTCKNNLITGVVDVLKASCIISFVYFLWKTRP